VADSREAATDVGDREAQLSGTRIGTGLEDPKTTKAHLSQSKGVCHGTKEKKEGKKPLNRLIGGHNGGTELRKII